MDPYALQKYQAALPTRDKIPCTAALAGTPDRKNLQNGRVLIPVPTEERTGPYSRPQGINEAVGSAEAALRDLQLPMKSFADSRS